MSRGGRGGHISLTHATALLMREVSGVALLLFRPVPLQTGSVLVCTPGKMQHPLSHVLQLVRGRASSPSLGTTELALLPDNEWGENTFSSPTPPQDRHGWGIVSSPALMPSGLDHLQPPKRVSSTVLFRQGTGPILPSVTASEGHFTSTFPLQ